ncbi:hypothetical protein [Psychrobacter sp.]|uniref:hypothetical protein n=1 Tax=Psychrobacter sp. TaxID=56811 RepID=UPI003BB18CB3
MSIFYSDSTFPVIKTVLLSASLIGIMQLMTGCDSQNLSPNNTVNSQTGNTDNTDKNIANKDKVSENTAPINPTIANEVQNKKAITLPNDKIVNLSGYQKLSFGQVITPELLSELGLTKEGSNNEQCYYVSNPKLSYVDKEYGERASVLYQVIDDKVALITIRDPNTPLYTAVSVGDPVKEVMKVHNDDLAYEVDKYAVDGDYYNLTANVNFKAIKDNEAEKLLKYEDIKFDNKEDKLPIQIEYHMNGGQKLNNYKIKATAWTADDKRMLQGQVKSIDIGIPEAIYLVEGCS